MIDNLEELSSKSYKNTIFDNTIFINLELETLSFTNSIFKKLIIEFTTIKTLIFLDCKIDCILFQDTDIYELVLENTLLTNETKIILNNSRIIKEYKMPPKSN